MFDLAPHVIREKGIKYLAARKRDRRQQQQQVVVDSKNILN